MHASAAHPGRWWPALLAAALAGCAGWRPAPVDDEPTLASLNGRTVTVAPDAGIAASETHAIAAYRDFLAAAPQAPQRALAMRRLGDLEMDGAEREAGDGARPDYRAAIARYQAILNAYPQDRANDRVLYQLARAYEQSGAVETALATLTRLVAEHPDTGYRDEAEFRRGELLFATRQYAAAEQAYASVLQGGGASPLTRRALYMQGWSMFKQGRLAEALQPFFGVLDAQIGALAPDANLDQLPRAERELVDDTLRVTGIALANLQGAASIAPLVTSEVRRGYAYRVYASLADLYLHQQRVKDAADTLAAFARAQPQDAQAPVLLSRVIGIYEGAGFAGQALAAKQDYVLRYGATSGLRHASPAAWQRAQPLVKTHLVELARHFHALAQRSHDAADVQAAVRWYRELLGAFPDDADTPDNDFLLAELLFENHRDAEAAAEYERVAYALPAGAHGADAGYAALLAYARQGERGTPAVASALRFADCYRSDARAASVLTNAADQLYALHDDAQAERVARRALALQPGEADRRTAWTVIGHVAFGRRDFAAAEPAYAQALALTAAGAPDRAALVERLAASVYEQGDAARAAGRPRDAVAYFERVAAVAPGSTVQATALFDAAASMIELKDWAGAAARLEEFRRRFPDHPLQAQVSAKLAAADLALERWAPAAAEFERVAAAATEPEVARGALWQAAELHEKAADGRAAAAWGAYVQRFAQPLEPAVEARWRAAQATPEPARALAWMTQIVAADAAGGEARTARTRTLAAKASLALAAPAAQAFRAVALVEPLKKTLALKKVRMEQALAAYATAADYGIAEVATAATFETASLYQDFGRALLASQRPKRMSRAEREQYEVMLEEQAFPFEEKAIALHELNARRSADGVYDDAVRASLAALARLQPLRWGKFERVDAGADAAAALDAQGIALRREGRFQEARAAYEQALVLAPQRRAVLVNLAILYDLYLGDAAQARSLYERALALDPTPDAELARWVAEIQRRQPGPHLVTRKDPS